MRTTVRLLAAASLSASLLAVPSPAHAANDTYVEPFDASEFTGGLPTNANAVRARSILANANEYALTTWYNTVKNYDAQTATYLSFGGTTQEKIRPPASEAYALAVALATGGYNASATGVSQADAKTIALKLTRSLAKAHRANTAGGWGAVAPPTGFSSDPGWQTAMWAALAGNAGWLLWNDLAASDREYVRKMVEAEANRFIGYQVPYWKDRNGNYTAGRGCGDSAAEENAWNARIVFLAPVMMPQHSRRSGWTYKANELSVGAFSTPADLTSSQDFRGRPYKDWLEGTNVNNDGSLVNHTLYHPDYMATVTENIGGALSHALSGRPVPLNAVTGSSRIYDALVDKQWWPSPAPPCSGAEPYQAPGTGNPTGTMYIDSSDNVYYPQGNDWGTTRRAHFAELDAAADAFNFDNLVAEKGSTWEPLHAQKVLDMQNRPLAGGAPSDGSTYRTAEEDTYFGREEWVAAAAAELWLIKWLDHQGALTTTNSVEQIVVDNADRGVTVTGTWTLGNPTNNGVQVFGASSRYKAAGSGSASVRFTPRLSTTHTYQVYAWWHSASGQATDTPYTINHASGTTTVDKNQQVNGGAWNLLGTYTLGPGDYVQVSDLANGYVVADGILLQRA